MFLFLFLVVATSQNKSDCRKIFLKDGSVLYGTLHSESSDFLSIRLQEGVLILIPEHSIAKVKSTFSQPTVLADARNLKTLGTYSKVALQMLLAHRSSQDDDQLRWGFGGNISGGYRVAAPLGFGIGFGVDANEYVFAPVFAEMDGYLLRKRNLASQRLHSSRWKRVFPLSYKLAIGYNFPLHEWISGEKNFETLKGGVMINPSIALLIPTYSGQSFRIELGYKFQKFKRLWEVDWRPGFLITDQVSLRSLAIGIGWDF